MTSPPFSGGALRTLNRPLPGGVSWVSELHTALPELVPEAGGGGEAAAVPAVLLVLAVAAVRREAQVGGCGQVLCAAVHLKGRRSLTLQGIIWKMCSNINLVLIYSICIGFVIFHHFHHSYFQSFCTMTVCLCSIPF